MPDFADVMTYVALTGASFYVLYLVVRAAVRDGIRARRGEPPRNTTTSRTRRLDDLTAPTTDTVSAVGGGSVVRELYGHVFGLASVGCQSRT